MAKKAYIGVNNVARKIKKGYVGIDGVARKIKKAYIGIGGVARPCWSGGELAYYGTITGLSAARGYLAAATVGDYALFAGGRGPGGRKSYTYNTVDAYDTSLTRTAPTALSEYKDLCGSAAINNRAVFAGGYTSSSTASRVVEYYNSSLTRAVLSTKLDVGLQDSKIAGGVVGNYAVFYAGTTINGWSVYGFNIWSSSLTKQTSISVGRQISAGDRGRNCANTGDYLVFTGGYAMSASLTLTTYNLAAHSVYQPAATSIGGYALFTEYQNMYAYNSSLTRTSLDNLSSAKYYPGATSLGEYAVFCGGSSEDGYAMDSGQTPTIDVYDKSLVHTTLSANENIRARLGAATIGDFALFAGGWGSTSNSSSDQYTVNTVHALTI